MESPLPPPPLLSADQYRNWLDLPREVTASILRRLDVIEILTSAQKVCMLWRSICKDPSMWRMINMGYVRNRWSLPYDLDQMCRHAVDLSCGQLVGIKLGWVCTVPLLEYITESSSRLRYLEVAWCYILSVKEWCEANIPLLEELELSDCCLGTETVLKAVGRSCPHLKSLKLRSKYYWGDPFKGCDLWAVTIAENMPGLVSLLLVGNELTNDGLQAILDGCPHLQSLELIWRCRHVSMEGDFGRKCSERIKNFRFHCFSDQEFEKILKDGGYYNYEEDDCNDYENFGLDQDIEDYLEDYFNAYENFRLEYIEDGVVLNSFV
ncbi:hypothetical protein I3843_10G084900 [Carya illinoinensis]|uniref:F-box domain-containing protein n=1 Tax=Carya illinoinensis TaxID=32201 RepID=A0A922DW23_CARIL|nr:hypothetical protein I3842_10G087000 [Carya illinoinensis]KAG7959746.1 hypothetical protein I3843_10G084900 [Carya illinoinensis]